MLGRILEAASLARSDTVLEVGAGIGALTLGLADAAGWVTAVEVDRRLIPVLQATAGPRPNVRIVQADILGVDLSPIFADPEGAARKVVANLPYNIASAVIARMLEPSLRLAAVVVTVQREVAERLVARPGGRDYGILSVAVQYRASARILARVPPGAFYPPPAVESALVELRPRAAPAADVDEAAFFRVVRAGFGQRRKTLPNALAHGLGLPREVVDRACAGAGIDLRARAETVDLAKFARLTTALDASLHAGPRPPEAS